MSPGQRAQLVIEKFNAFLSLLLSAHSLVFFPKGERLSGSSIGLRRKHGVIKIESNIAFVVAHRCASHNVVFFAVHRVVNVVMAPKVMMGEQRNYFESVPGASVQWWVLMRGRLEWVGCDGGGGGVWLQVEEEGEGER